MAKEAKKRLQTRKRNAMRTRRRIRISSDRPRLSVYRSLCNIYCQIIDDENGKTLVSASSKDKDIRDGLKGLKKTEIAGKVGAAIAAKAKESGVSRVVLDRGPFKYHGRVKALAEAAREGGLEF
ncbi:MAG: 50S ribosomal protein L18 [Planctomycetota bacterium]|jgi:large subunit ribosomal protein L18